MIAYAALLRAVNVGGTGKLAMTELAAMCREVGFTDPRTYIASGNVVFRSDEDAVRVRAALEERLLARAGKPVDVMIRTAAELAGVLERNPFAGLAPNRTIVLFLPEPPSATATTDVTGLGDERIALGERELYVHYGEGMARSKLRLSAERIGTGRNINTVAKLAAMTAA